MATWEDVVCKAKELADAAGRKVSDMAEVTKQKLKIVENERAIRDVLEALGTLLYESVKSGESPDAEMVAELVKQIEDLKATNEELKAEIDHYCGKKTCDCGAANPHGAAFCSTCGKKL